MDPSVVPVAPEGLPGPKRSTTKTSKLAKMNEQERARLELEIWHYIILTCIGGSNS